MEIHIGRIIANRLNTVGMSKSEFARRIGKARQNVNDILNRKSMDSDLLLNISKALNFNFFNYYIQMLDSGMVLKEADASYGNVQEELFECKLALKEKEKDCEIARREAELLREIVDLYKMQQKKEG